MLIPSGQLVGAPILSLHLSGFPIAHVVEPIIDPRNLKIVGLIVDGPEIGQYGGGDILDVRSIRDYVGDGIVINSEDEFLTREDAIRIGKVLDMHFEPIGMRVVTKKGTRLGKVVDYTFNILELEIRQFIVQRPALKAIVDPELTISHSQIVEITDREIIVKDEEDKIRKEAAAQEFIPNFVNPFRKPQYAPAQNQTPAGKDKQ